jgi:hypothetical protein
MRNRVLAFLVIAGACGRVRNGGMAEPGDAAVLDVAGAADGMPAVVDRNCIDVKARLGAASDGVHWIDPDLDGSAYKPFRVFCGGMSTPTPVEYLELAHTSRASDAPPMSNFSTYGMGAPHASWTCDCGVATTLYSKLRIDPITLVISSADMFAVFSDSTQLTCMQTNFGCPGISPYATAESCIAQHFAGGTANVDLRDTGFHIAGTDASMFKRTEELDPGNGFTSEGTAVVDDTRKIANITGGGDCGGFGAVTGLQLAQDP